MSFGSGNLLDDDAGIRDHEIDKRSFLDILETINNTPSEFQSQTLEFLAIQLFSKEEGEHSIIVASPIYVALAE